MIHLLDLLLKGFDVQPQSNLPYSFSTSFRHLQAGGSAEDAQVKSKFSQDHLVIVDSVDSFCKLCGQLCE